MYVIIHFFYLQIEGKLPVSVVEENRVIMFISRHGLKIIDPTKQVILKNRLMFSVQIEADYWKQCKCYIKCILSMVPIFISQSTGSNGIKHKTYYMYLGSQQDFVSLGNFTWLLGSIMISDWLKFQISCFRNHIMKYYIVGMFHM